jgi:hypothetical protein
MVKGTNYNSLFVSQYNLVKKLPGSQIVGILFSRLYYTYFLNATDKTRIAAKTELGTVMPGQSQLLS